MSNRDETVTIPRWLFDLLCERVEPDGELYEVKPGLPPQWQRKPTCQKCGIELGQVMGYCCPYVDCPTGMGPIMCVTLGTSSAVDPH